MYTISINSDYDRYTVYFHCSLPHTMPLNEGILRLGLNNFQSKAECGEAGRESVAAEGRWVGLKPFNAVLPFRWKCPKIYTDFVLVLNLCYSTITWYMYMTN